MLEKMPDPAQGESSNFDPDLLEKILNASSIERLDEEQQEPDFDFYDPEVQGLLRYIDLLARNKFKINFDKMPGGKEIEMFEEVITKKIRRGLDELDVQYKQLYKDKQYPEALELATRSAKLAYDYLDEDDPAVTSSLERLGNLQHEMSQYEGALSTFNRLLIVRMNISEPKQIATTLNDIGSTLYKLGQLENANEYYEWALKIQREALDE